MKDFEESEAHFFTHNAIQMVENLEKLAIHKPDQCTAMRFLQT